MIRSLYKTILPVMLCLMVLQSCQKNFEQINTDPINQPLTSASRLLAPALVGTMAANMVRNRNFNNELMQVTVNQSDADAAVFRYEYRNTLADYLWDNWYIQLTNFKDIYTQASTEGALNTSYQGISLICQSWVYSLLTDAYGDIPYFNANQGRNRILEPAFDHQRDIYLDIFKQLEQANVLLTAATPIESATDPVFNGDVAKWRKLGNTLYLRLLLRVSGKTEVSAQTIAKIKEIAETKSAEYPLMQGNEDSAFIKWTGTGPYTSPYVLSVRAQDFRAPAISNFFIDHLRDWNDPRINISTYGRNGVNRWGIVPGASGFAGVPSGYRPFEGAVRQSYFYATDQRVADLPAQTLQNDPFTGIIITYAELQFILAEAAIKGWVSGSAQTYYNTGILNSITYWIPAFASSITDESFTSYINEADITWNDAETMSQKMEAIHLQKYYALFLTDMQQWYEHRRTGHPVLPKGPGLNNGGIMPARFTYPVYVQSANPTNYRSAIQKQGPDVLSTQVWWQKP